MFFLHVYRLFCEIKVKLSEIVSQNLCSSKNISQKIKNRLDVKEGSLVSLEKVQIKVNQIFGAKIDSWLDIYYNTSRIFIYFY